MHTVLSMLAAAADPHATSIEQRTVEQIRTAMSALEQRITEHFVAVSLPKLTASTNLLCYVLLLLNC
jgi:hypothetical protein